MSEKQKEAIRRTGRANRGMTDGKHDPERVGINTIRQIYKNRAGKANLPFELSNEAFYKLVKQDCAYCGHEPRLRIIKHRKTHNYECMMNGVDRIDSNKGYTSNNVAPCCMTCNYMKRKLSVNEFIQHCHEIVLKSLE